MACSSLTRAVGLVGSISVLSAAAGAVRADARAPKSIAAAARLGRVTSAALIAAGERGAADGSGGVRCVSCQGGDVAETEPNCGFPIDVTNGGCNSTPPIYSPIAAGQTVCGTSAMRTDPVDPNFIARDTDWYELTLATRSLVTWTVTAQFDVLVGIIDTGGVPGCPAGSFRVATFGAPCAPTAVSACLEAGTWYLFVAPDFFGSTFPLACGATYRGSVSVAACPPPPANDECNGALTVACGSSATTDNTFATEGAGDAPFSCHFGGAELGYGTVWFKFQAADTSAVVSLCDSSVGDTLLAVYSGSCGGLTEIACNDDAPPCGLASSVCASGLTIGSTYYIMAASWEAAERGVISVAVTCPCPSGPSNDECAGALGVACNGTAATDNTDATEAAGDPVFPCRVGGAGPAVGTVWFSFVADDPVATIDTNLSTGIEDTLLGVFSGDCGALTLIGCDDDGGTGFLSRVTVSGLTVGQTYRICVGAYDSGSARGDIVVSVTCGAPATYCAAGAVNGCAAGAPNEYISRVSIRTIDNGSGCGTATYENFTALSTSVSRGVAASITVRVANYFSGDTVTVFCDWNQNLILNDPGEAVALIDSGSGEPRAFTGAVTAPAGALLGATRMRVRMAFGSSADPCGNTTWGNIEDYTLIVGAACPCVGFFATGVCATDQDALDVVLFNFGTGGHAPFTNGDLDGDGDVDQDDLDFVLFDFGCSG